MKFYCVTIIFDLQIFDNETKSLLIFFFCCCFEICTRMRFVSLVFPNERYISTSLLKFTALHYGNLSSSSIDKLYLSQGSSNMLFRFFRFFFYVYFIKAFFKNILNNFLIQLSQDILMNIRQNLKKREQFFHPILCMIF